jgi:PPP family 3-phenylpropionic acid transporter
MDWTLLKGHYVFVYAILGAVLPYMPLYLQERGLGEAQTGWVLSLFGLAVIFSPPLLTHLADRWFSNRVVIAGCFAVTCLALGLLLRAQRFISLLACYALFSLGFTALIPLIDGLTFARIQRRAEQSGRMPFQRVRVWGSIGFMLPAIGLFLVLTRTPWGSVAAVWAGAGVALVAACSAMALPPRGASGDSERIWPTARAWRVLGHPPTFALVGAVFLLSMSVAVFYAFYPLYLDALAVPRRWIGLVVSLGVFAEVICMFLLAPIMQRLGIRGVMLAAAGALTLRLALLAARPTLPVALGTQVLHGPFVLGLYLVPTMYLNFQADERFRNSVQGVYAMLVFGLARLVGTPLGGYVAELAGAEPALPGLRAAFAWAAALGCAGVAWMYLGFRDEPACEALRAQHA